MITIPKYIYYVCVWLYKQKITNMNYINLFYHTFTPSKQKCVLKNILIYFYTKSYITLYVIILNYGIFRGYGNKNK